jgi:hypothetical protein
VFDLCGRRVNTGAPLKRGVYFVQRRMGKTILTKKILRLP